MSSLLSGMPHFPWPSRSGKGLPFSLQVGEGTPCLESPTCRPSSLPLPKAFSFLMKMPEMSLFGASAPSGVGVGDCQPFIYK